ncbi:hypothetical protein UFOVP860_3 [uncultured Caudovirales phage]|uniref:Uncharacterized protein n=1 Tax=uncultured Caudovirales phage TaxID=2100421 RepID=A0A6J5P5T8_9CAUD|nr:hypothetical protein UFOVP860_3 [uncultured Caudovirales phage]CAB4195210.1 hypothetical protein UFOVP1293_12 [uncultured Caudovirales phage]CAB4222411.1 hypothetical protein UFOVP1644_30 [uncultured Caudovirales phage]
MTPLAHAIVKDGLLPPRTRSFIDKAGVLARMDDIHCFEVTEVVDVARSLVSPDGAPWRPERFSGMATETSFLPAPKTWLEWRRGDIRSGALLIESGARAEVRMAYRRGPTWGGSDRPFQIGLAAMGGDSLEMVVPADLNDEEGAELSALSVELHAFLALINTPRIIGRRQHMPHRGLERALLSGRSPLGRFPLHAWTEIKLEVNATENASDLAPVDAHLTGQKALHFCRAHLRLKMGRVEIVRAHWRGDASLGIKRSRYAVVPAAA